MNKIITLIFVALCFSCSHVKNTEVVGAGKVSESQAYEIAPLCYYNHSSDTDVSELTFGVEMTTKRGTSLSESELSNLKGIVSSEEYHRISKGYVEHETNYVQVSCKFHEFLESSGLEDNQKKYGKEYVNECSGVILSVEANRCYNATGECVKINFALGPTSTYPLMNMIGVYVKEHRDKEFFIGWGKAGKFVVNFDVGGVKYIQSDLNTEGRGFGECENVSYMGW